MKVTRLAAAVALLVAMSVSALPAGATGVRNSGFYDHQIIEYEATFGTAASPQAALQISKGEIVYHIVDATGATPGVQCSRLLAALPNDATSCNTLNFIPTEVGYTGGAWNLQIFHWKAGVTPFELSKDDDIVAAAAAGLGTIEVTSTLVRCPLVNFAALR